jgi:phage shock protein PspC (stress-responsive transcriptional regulator)
MGGQERTGGVPLARATSGRWLGGVCAGLAPIRGLGVGWLRFGFVLLALLGGLGIAFYLACWLIIPVAGSSAEEEPVAAVAVAQACAAVVGLVALAALAGVLTLFGLGWIVAVLVAVVLAGVFAWRSRLGPAWALLPIVALTLPAVAVATSGLRLAPQAGDLIYDPQTTAQLQSAVYRSGLGSMLIDLRSTSFPASGDAVLRIDGGVRRTIVALPAGECVGVDVRYHVDPFVARLGALLGGRSTIPYSGIQVFGRLYSPHNGEVLAGGGVGDPTLTIDFSSQGGSLYVRDYPASVQPDVEPDWPGYPVKLEPYPYLRNEPKKLRPMIVRAWRARRRVELASQRTIDRLMPGPCG